MFSFTLFCDQGEDKKFIPLQVGIELTTVAITLSNSCFAAPRVPLYKLFLFEVTINKNIAISFIIECVSHELLVHICFVHKKKHFKCKT